MRLPVMVASISVMLKETTVNLALHLTGFGGEPAKIVVVYWPR